MTSFNPPAALRNPHVQSILASIGARKLRVLPRALPMLSASKPVTLNCGDNRQLLGEYSAQPVSSKGLITLIHGWEGSTKSTYMLATAGKFYQQGYDIFRLNLRDHGDSHHLNKALFHSARLDEVIEAIKEIHSNYPHAKQYLAGFSLGGNFALRIAAEASKHGIELEKTIAICPVIDPAVTMAALAEGWWLYEKYFVRKWKKSLRKKLALFPEFSFRSQLEKSTTLADMNEFFIAEHTEFATEGDYFAAYAITGERLASIDTPCHIISALDDPMMPPAELDKMAKTPLLTVETPEHGGHCGFINNFRLDCWLDQRFIELVSNTEQTLPKSSLSSNTPPLQAD